MNYIHVYDKTDTSLVHACCRVNQKHAKEITNRLKLFIHA